jgi:hypothetical protein
MSDEMKNEIDTNNFKTLIEALEELPEGIRKNRVNMSSAHEPVCGTVNQHCFYFFYKNFPFFSPICFFVLSFSKSIHLSYAFRKNTIMSS